MDPRQRKEMEAALEQGQAFNSLSVHPEWGRFRAWLEQARSDYDRNAHSPSTRADHIALVRSLESYETIDAVLRGFDRAINNVPHLREQLDGTDPSPR